MQALLDAYLAARPITVRVVDAEGNEVGEPGKVTLGGKLTLGIQQEPNWMLWVVPAETH